MAFFGNRGAGLSFGGMMLSLSLLLMEWFSSYLILLLLNLFELLSLLFLLSVSSSLFSSTLLLSSLSSSKLRPANGRT